MRAVQSVRCECSRHKCARCQDVPELHLTPTRARVPPPRQRRAETAHCYPAPPHQVTSHRARPRHQRADQRQAIHNPSIPFHAILPCHVMCSFEPTSSGITASNLQNPPVYRSYAHDAFQAPAPRATHVWNHGHMGSWVCETDKLKTWDPSHDDGYMGMMGM